MQVKFYDEIDDALLKYAVIITKSDGKWVFCKHCQRDTFGKLYFAEVSEFEEELHSEIEKIIFTEELVTNWTYPLIQPRLIEEAKRRGVIG